MDTILLIFTLRCYVLRIARRGAATTVKTIKRNILRCRKLNSRRTATLTRSQTWPDDTREWLLISKRLQSSHRFVYYFRSVLSAVRVCGTAPI